MAVAVNGRRGPGRPVRSILRDRLEARRGEIERAVLDRVNAIADMSDVADPAYAEGMRAAVPAALEYGFGAIDAGEAGEPQIPVALLGQARMAARNNISLDTVLRRYFAGYSLLGYFLIEEASRDGLMDGAELQRLLGTQTVYFDRLIGAISEEHGRESDLRGASLERRQAERIERLLAGEMIDTGGIRYDFDANHVGLVASGSGAAAPLRRLATSLDRVLLLVDHAEDTVWAWLGGRRPVDPDAFEHAITTTWPADLALARGEPAAGLDGWRLTLRQARAALPLAQRSPGIPIRYIDVALVVAAIRDELLATSLRQAFLMPLSRERDGGKTLRETLRAYLAADGNSASAAAALSVTRQTVNNRLRAVEARLPRPLRKCTAELDVALRAEALGDDPTQRASN